ncbi:MAG: class I SAM-dependent methyltransferase [Deltaproteobacteria bacterium]|nr:class I SAM-dependent methyltransferase [Deltaproteobacteria bacterium]
MNNPVREAIQRHLEARWLLAMGGPVAGARALEIGCGRGVGTELVLDVFRAEHVDAFDLDPDMIARARERLAPRGDRVRLWVGDAEHIDAEAATYDAVFDFGIVHHVPRWRDVLAEVYRVLKPGGRFYAEEVLAKLILDPVWSRLTDHPSADRFDGEGFRAALVATGFEIVASKGLLDRFVWFVARKPTAS